MEVERSQALIEVRLSDLRYDKESSQKADKNTNSRKEKYKPFKPQVALSIETKYENTAIPVAKSKKN